MKIKLVHPSQLMKIKLNQPKKEQKPYPVKQTQMAAKTKAIKEKYEA